MKGVQKKNLTGAKCENNISSVNEETIMLPMLLLLSMMDEVYHEHFLN